MRIGDKSDCQEKCDYGFTTNGDRNPKGGICVPCDSSCDGCADDGNVNDFKKCLNCNPSFTY